MNAGARTGWAAASLTAILAACQSVAPDPEAYAARELPEVGLDPTKTERLRVLVEQALAELAADRHARAEERARDALDLDPRSARARAVLGSGLLARAAEQQPPDFRLMRTADGETLLALRLAPADPVVGLLRARFLSRTEHLSAAAEVAEQVLERCAEPDSEAATELLWYAAELRYELGEEHAARPHLLELVRRRPDDPTLRFRLAMCHLKIGASTADLDKIGESVTDFDAAAAEFAACVERSPDDEQAHLAVGQAKFRAAKAVAEAGGDDAPAQQRARLLAALAAFDTTIERFPGSSAAWFGRGVVLERLERPEDAVAAYEHAIERGPEHLGAHLNLGALLAAAAERQPERLPRAEVLLRRALELGGRGAGRLSSEERRRIEDWLQASR